MIIIIFIEDKDISINSNFPILISHIINKPMVSKNHSMHLHDCIEIYFFVSGDVDFMVEDKYFPLKSGDIIITNPNNLHKPIIKSSEEYERFYIKLSPYVFSFITRGENPLDAIKNKNIFISTNDKNYEKILNIADKISTLLENKSSTNYYLMFSYFLQFIDAINGLIGEENNIKNRTAIIPNLIKEVLRYIDNSTNVCSVKELAEIFHINPSYLSALFSETTHTTLKQYITTKKIAKSKTLLSETLSISEIAYECGFSSCSHFISVFKQNTGITPREYRMKTPSP